MYQNTSNYNLCVKKFEKLNNDYELCYNKNSKYAERLAKELFKITRDCLDLSNNIKTISDYDRIIYRETIKKLLDQYPNLKTRGTYFVKRSPTRKNPETSDMLIVSSRVKAYAKSKGGMSIGEETLKALDKKVRQLIDDATARAKALGRTQLKVPHI